MLHAQRSVAFVLVGLAFQLFTSQAADGQNQRAQQPERLVLRTYEVGDLTLAVRDRPFKESLLLPPAFGGGAPAPVSGGGGGGLGGGGFGGGMGGGGGAFSVPDNGPRLAQRGMGGRGGMGMGGMSEMGEFGPTSGPPVQISDTQVTLSSIAQAIVTTVAPDSWRGVGGEGVITNVGSALVIAQSTAVHQQIEGLLGALRAGSNHRRTLRIDARWLLLSSDDLDALVRVKGGEATVDRTRLAEYTRRPNSRRGITNCFSGQLVYLVSGTRRNAVSSYIPVVGEVEQPWESDYQLVSTHKARFKFASDRIAAGQGQAGVGYQPVLTELNFGALLQIRPTLLKDDDAVVVDLESTITVAGQAKPEPQTDAAGAPARDQIEVETQQLATTLRVPLGKPYLVGGMTYQPSAGADANGGRADAGENSQLYLVLEVQ